VCLSITDLDCFVSGRSDALKLCFTNKPSFLNLGLKWGGGRGRNGSVERARECESERRKIKGRSPRDGQEEGDEVIDRNESGESVER
jgi:hypothetical protein